LPSATACPSPRGRRATDRGGEKRSFFSCPSLFPARLPTRSELLQVSSIPRFEATNVASVECDEPILRVATSADETALEALMKESAAALFPRFYNQEQAASAVRYVPEIDRMLLEDGTYFVLEAGGEAVACGGWSRRDRLYTGSGDEEGDARSLDPATEPARIRAMFVRPEWTRRGLGRGILEACEEAARREGFRRLVLMSTLPGVPLYLAYGFRSLEEVELTLPDGVKLPGVSMDKPIERPIKTDR
jgi:GNAT superfamily N-acetyltransferase